ncbi:MAG: hypothetical protein AB7Q42_22135 [Acidimicrobiia bacterium]
MRRPVNPAPSTPDATASTTAPTTTVTATGSTPAVTVVETTSTLATGADSSTSAPGTTVAPVASGLVLRADGLGGALFGAQADSVIAYINGVAGPPTADSGWVDALESPFGACSGPRVRGVQWGQLQLLFGDESSVSSAPGHFFSYRYGGFTGQPPAPEGLHTDVGLALGSPLAQIRDAYPSVTVFEDPLFGVGFTITQGGLSGTLTDATDDGQVQVLYGGIGCGE